LAPGFLDVHVHLREPGGEQAETIETGCRAAVHGGFTGIVSMPNTRPPIDTPEQVRYILEKAEQAGTARVYPSACITQDRAGCVMADLEGLAEAGAVFFTDDGTAVPSEDLLRRAMERSAELDKPVVEHAQDPRREKKGVMHQGIRSEEMGLPGIPSGAEADIIKRDIALAEQTGCRLHIQHVSSAEGVEAIRYARECGLPVSGEATPHHLALCDTNIPGDDANFKMNPPLRSIKDREAVRAGIADGTLGMFATDHAPHQAECKARGFLKAPFGVVGLETAIGVTYTLMVLEGYLDLHTWIRRWTTGPAELMGLPAPRLKPGFAADLVLLDLHKDWKVDPDRFSSKSRNTPFGGKVFKGQPVATWKAGNLVYENL
jgi:dihydroorotase